MGYPLLKYTLIEYCTATKKKMPDILPSNAIDIQQLALIMRTTPGSIRCYISKGILRSFKLKLKKGARPINAFEEEKIRKFIREHQRICEAAKFRHKLESQRVYTLLEARDMTIIAKHLDKTLWGKMSFNESGELMISFQKSNSETKTYRYIDLQVKFATKDVRTIVDHPRIGFCLITYGKIHDKGTVKLL